MAKRRVKQVLAAVLAGCMTLTSIPVPAAQTTQTDEEQLKEQLRNGVSDEEYPDGMFRFWATQLEVEEGDAVSILICRQGNTDKEASVTFKTIDVSAVYEEDYLLTAVHSTLNKELLEKNEDSVPLMNQRAEVGEQQTLERELDEPFSRSSNFVSSNTADQEPAENTEDDENLSAEGEETVTEPLTMEQTFGKSSGSSLAMAYEMQRHEQAPENDWKETNPGQLPEGMEEAVDEGEKEGIDTFRQAPGQETVLTFAPGEYKKEIRFETMDDTKSESQEQVLFAMLDAQGCVIGPEYNGYVNIKDNEETIESVFEIENKQIAVYNNENVARVNILRTQGTDRIAVLHVGTKAIDAIADEDYQTVDKEIVFAPGETTKEFEVPIQTRKDRDTHFYAGIIPEEGGEVSEQYAAKVTVLARGSAPLSGQTRIVYGDTAPVGEDAEPQNKSGAIGVLIESPEGEGEDDGIRGKDAKEDYNTHSFGHDFRLAKEIVVGLRFYGVKMKKGCSSYEYYYDKKARVQIKDRSTGKVLLEKTQEFYGKNEVNDYVIFTRKSESDLTEWESLSDVYVYAEIWGINGNDQAAFDPGPQKAYYYQNRMPLNFTINNANDAQTYKEKIYSGNKSYEEGQKIRLGEAYFDGDPDKTETTAYWETIDLGYRFLDHKTSTGVQLNSNTVRLEGYGLKKSGTGTVITKADELMNGKIDYDFVKKYKSYLYSGNLFVIVPIFKPVEAEVTFESSDPKKVEFRGYDNGSKMKITKLDSLRINAAPATGYSVDSIQIKATDNSYVNSNINSNNADKTSLTTGLGNVSATEYKVNLNYANAQIKVMPDPDSKSLDRAKQGAVAYLDPDNNLYKASLDKSLADSDSFIIPNVNMNETYTIIGSARSGYDTSWKDGTLDADEDGDKIPEEQDGYRSFLTVRGSALPYTAKMAVGRIYYSFAQKPEVSKYPKTLYGYLYLKDRHILTNEYQEKGINGANITANGKTTTTTHGGIAGYEDDGYFQIVDHQFSMDQKYLVNVNVYGEVGSINTSFVMTPNYIKDCAIDTDEDLHISNAKVFVAEYNEATKKYGSFQQQTISKNEKTKTFTDVANGPDKVRIEMRAEHPGQIIEKGELEFYDPKGKLITGKTVKGTPIGDTNSGDFRFEFVPNDEKLMLEPGTSVRVSFTDKQGHTYLQRELGMTLSKYYGNLDIANNFGFGGRVSVIELVGNINSALNLGWNGSFNSTNSKYVERMSNGDRVITVGFDKGVVDWSSKNGLTDKAVAMAEAEQAFADKKKEYEKFADKSEMTSADKEKLDKLNKEMKELTDDLDKKKKSYEDGVKDANEPKKEKPKLAAKATMDLGFSFAITFGNDGYDYYLKGMVMTAKVSGGFGVKVSYCTPIGVTISMGFDLGGDGSASFVVVERQDISEELRKKYYLQTMDNDEGTIYNLFDVNMNDNDRSFDAYGSFRLQPFIQITGGISITGLSVDLSGRCDFDMQFYTDEKSDYGTATLSASLTATVIGIEAGPWTFASKDFDLFGEKGASSLLPEGETFLYESADVLKAKDYSYLNGGARWKEGAISAKALDESPNGYAEESIAAHIGDLPGFDMADLGGGRYAAVFLNPDMGTYMMESPKRSAQNAAAVYYTVYNGGSWSAPQLVEDDGKLDQEPRIYSLGDKGAVIIWSAADKVFDDSVDKVDRQNSLNLHCAFLDNSGVLNKTTIKEITRSTDLTSIGGMSPMNRDYSDVTADVCANVSYNDDRLIVYYQKKEYAKSGAQEEVLGDVFFPNITLMSAMTYDFATGTWKQTYNDEETETIKSGFGSVSENIADQEFEYYQNGFYGQRFFEFLPVVSIQEKQKPGGYLESEPVHTALTKAQRNKAVITDSDAMSFNDLGAFAYTMDMDGSLSTVRDREIMMQIYDFQSDRFKYPIMITGDDLEDQDVSFVRVPYQAGQTTAYRTYLTWIHNGDIVGMDMSDLVGNYETLLEDKEVGGIHYYSIRTDHDETGLFKACTTTTFVEGAKVASVTGSDTSAPVDNATVSENDAGEQEEKAKISEFKVNASGDYVYFLWTQGGSQLAEGIDKDSSEAQDAANYISDQQLYVARYDIAGGEMTEPVKVTSTVGANYSDIDFMVQDDKMIGLAYKAPSTPVSLEEFNARIDEHNKSLSADEKELEKANEATYIPFYEKDEANAVPVSFKIDPKGYVKIKEAGFIDRPVAGSSARASFEVLNDSVETTQKLTLTAEAVGADGETESVLLGQLEETGDPEAESVTTGHTVRQINVTKATIAPMIGGSRNRYFCELNIPEDAEAAEFMITLKNPSGEVLAEEKVTRELVCNVIPEEITAEQTDVRNEYLVSAKLVNRGSKKVPAGKVEIGTEAGGKNVMAEHEDILPGETAEISQRVTLDSARDFTVRENKAGAVSENAVIYVKTSDAQDSVTVTRESDPFQMEAVSIVRSISVKGAESDRVKVKAGESTLLTPVLDVEDTTAEFGEQLSGWERLQYRFETEDDDVISVEKDGRLTALKNGSAKVKVVVYPINNTFEARNNDGKLEDGIFGNPSLGKERDIYPSVVESAVLTKEITVEVTGADKETKPATPETKPSAPAVTPSAGSDNAGKSQSGDTAQSQTATTKIGDVITDSKQTAAYVVIGADTVSYKGIEGAAKADKKAKSETVPATIKGSDGKTYKVTEISADAFKNRKYLTKITIGKNVKKIGKNAFMGCKKLKTVKIKCQSLKKIGKNAFKNIKKTAVFKLYGKKKRKTAIRKLLKKKVGFKKATMKIKG